MYLKKLIFALFVCITLPVSAQQFPADFWHNGEVELFSDDLVTGLVKYDLKNNTIQLQMRNGKIRAFGAQSVRSFSIFDELTKNVRHFYTLPYPIKANFESPVFFELLTEGRADLLNREVYSRRMLNNPSPYGMDRMLSVITLEDSYYVLTAEGKVYPAQKTKKSFLRFLDDPEGRMKQFARDKNIDFTLRDDLLLLFDRYNGFFPEEE